MKRKASLDAKQKALAMKFIEFRKKLLDETNNFRNDRQLSQNMRSFDNALSLIRDVARKLRRYDNRMFTMAIEAIKSLQGDISLKQ